MGQGGFQGGGSGGGGGANAGITTDSVVTVNGTQAYTFPSIPAGAVAQTAQVGSVSYSKANFSQSGTTITFGSGTTITQSGLPITIFYTT